MLNLLEENEMVKPLQTFQMGLHAKFGCSKPKLYVCVNRSTKFGYQAALSVDGSAQNLTGFKLVQNL